MKASCSGKSRMFRRVQDCAHARYGDVGLHVGLVVPHEGGDAIAALNTELFEGLRELLGARHHLGEGGHVDSRRGDGEDLLLRIDRDAVSNDVTYQQRRVLHRALHVSPSGRLPRCYKISCATRTQWASAIRRVLGGPRPRRALPLRWRRDHATSRRSPRRWARALHRRRSPPASSPSVASSREKSGR